MHIFGCETDQAKCDSDLFLWISERNGGACAPVTKGCLAGVSAEAVGNGGRAVSVAIDDDAEAKVDNMAKGGVEFPLAPSVSEFLQRGGVQNGRSCGGGCAARKKAVVKLSQLGS